MTVSVTPKDMSAPIQTSLQDVEPPSTITPKEEPKPEPIQEDTLSPKYAALARQQKMLRQQQRAVEDQKKALEADLKAIEDAKAWKQRLKQDPYGVMLEQGLTADEVASLMLNQPDVGHQKLSLLEQRIKAQDEQIQQLLKGTEEREAQNRTSAKGQILHDVKKLVERDSESYEFVKDLGDDAYTQVVDLIEKTFDEHGYVMETTEAIDKIENDLLEKSLRFAKLKKFQSKLNPTPVTDQPEQDQKNELTQKKEAVPTLSNRMAIQTAKPLTARERRERAIAAFKGQLS